MKNYTLEACADSVESALAATRGGASRIELCSNLVIGGTTPSPCLFKEIRKHSDIRVHALIRPRFGDFCYTDFEFAIIQEEVKMFRELGAEGVVIGILKSDGTLNLEQLEILKKLSGNMKVTLHRAFDVCVDPYHALEQAINLGMDTILTSGQKNVCTGGKKLIKELVEKGGDRVEIQVGSGVSADVIQEMYQATHARAYHMSGKITLDSTMEYRKEDVNMGLPNISEFEILRTEEDNIREARQVLEEL